MCNMEGVLAAKQPDEKRQGRGPSCCYTAARPSDRLTVGARPRRPLNNVGPGSVLARVQLGRGRFRDVLLSEELIAARREEAAKERLE